MAWIYPDAWHVSIHAMRASTSMPPMLVQQIERESGRARERDSKRAREREGVFVVSLYAAVPSVLSLYGGVASQQVPFQES